MAVMCIRDGAGEDKYQLCGYHGCMYIIPFHIPQPVKDNYERWTWAIFSEKTGKVNVY